MFVSLKNEEAQQVTKVLSNPTAKKIMEYLSTHTKATETSLSKKLRLPLSTVHYTLAQLTKSKLVTIEEFHYSQKGREVQHYSLANQFIVFTPHPVWDIREKLSQVLPMVALAGGISYWIQQKFGMIAQYAPTLAAPTAAKVAPEIVEALPAAQNIAYDSLEANLVSMGESLPAMAAPPIQTIPIGWYFFLGFVLALVLYLVYDYYRSRR